MNRWCFIPQILFFKEQSEEWWADGDSKIGSIDHNIEFFLVNNLLVGPALFESLDILFDFSMFQNIG